jgi:hypothetical protein
MWQLIHKIPYSVLIIIAVLTLLAPFSPMPHLVEKLILLKAGNLSRPLDIFDLFFHSAPTIVLILKLYYDFMKRK